MVLGSLLCPRVLLGDAIGTNLCPLGPDLGSLGSLWCPQAPLWGLVIGPWRLCKWPADLCLCRLLCDCSCVSWSLAHILPILVFVFAGNITWCRLWLAQCTLKLARWQAQVHTEVGKVTSPSAHWGWQGGKPKCTLKLERWQAQVRTEVRKVASPSAH